MRILFTRFPLVSALHGGAENQTIALMEGLKKQGHRVEFLGSCPALLGRTKELGLRNWELQIGAPPVTKWGAISFLWRRRRMRTSLIDSMGKLTANRLPLTALVMLSLSEKLLLTEWAANKGINVLWIEHDRIGPWLTRNPWLPALRRASKHATIVCVSELSRKRYVEMGFDPARIVVIPNGIAIPSSSPSPFSRREKGSTMKVICIARLSPEKGVDILIQSIGTLPEINLTIVGSGSEEGYLRHLIAEDTQRLGMGEPRIHMIRDVPDLDPIYASADVLVLPSSDHDPFGLVASEAMMRGIPVIVTDACGIAGYLRDGDDAFIADAGSVESLTQAIAGLEDPEMRQQIGSAGQKTALREFSVDRMVAGYVDVLR